MPIEQNKDKPSELKCKLSLDVSDFKQQLNEIEEQLDRIADKSKNVFSRFENKIATK